MQLRLPRLSLRRLPIPMTTPPEMSTLNLRLAEWHRNGRPRIEPVRSWPDPTIDENPIICPSQSPEDGTILLGYMTSEGKLDRTIKTETENQLRGSERFAGECQQSRCAFWADSCQLAAVLIQPVGVIGPLPVCDYRQRCRWWIEHGPSACHTCEFVTYRSAG
jgi:hypothetical protein